MKKKAIIISIKGKNLSNKEKLLLSKEKPWGIILFKRNIHSFKQTKNLIKNIKKHSKDKNFPILIDEEGVEVSRLRNFFNHNLNASFFGEIYKLNKNVALSLYKNYLKSLCKYLKSLGLNMNTIPVLDVLRKNTNKIIGKRSFSKNKIIVKELGEVTVKECHYNKIINIIKHMPGHGCTSVDSHLNEPRISLSENKFKFVKRYRCS